MSETKTIHNIVDSYFDTLGRLEIDRCLDLFTGEAVVVDPVGSPPAQGKQEIRRHLAGIAGLFRKIQFIQEDRFVVAGGAAVKWTAEGWTQDDRRVRVGGIDVFEINEEGLIRRLWGYWDPQALTKTVC